MDVVLFSRGEDLRRERQIDLLSRLLAGRAPEKYVSPLAARDEAIALLIACGYDVRAAA